MTDECVNGGNIAAAADGAFSRPVEGLTDQGDQHLSTPDVNVGSKQKRGGIKDIDGNNINSSDSDDEFSCDGCGCMMSGSPGTKWFRCTECGDLDICRTCQYIY